MFWLCLRKVREIGKRNSSEIDSNPLNIVKELDIDLSDIADEGDVDSD